MKVLIVILLTAVLAIGIVVYFNLPLKFNSTPTLSPAPSLGVMAEKPNLIRVFNPRINEVIKSPLIVKGEARGNWYFEATFPIVLTDWDGRIIAQHYAQAESEWMTTDFVPFEATLEFENPAFPGSDESHFSRRGYLILKKDNPSGLPEHDNSIEIPIFFE